MAKRFGLFLVALALTSCGELKTEEEEVDQDATEYVKLNIQGSDSAIDGQHALTRVDECSLDADSGLLKTAFSASTKDQLEISIKGFSTEASSSYSCTQAPDNQSGDLGSKYNGCGVKLILENASGNTDSYSSYRDSSDVKDFTYASDCTINVTYADNALSGSVSCANLVQTHLDGAPRNPIDTSVVATLASGSTFQCQVSSK